MPRQAARTARLPKSIGIEDTIAANFGNRRYRHGDDWSTRGHRLERRKAKSFVQRGKDHGLAVLVEYSQLIRRDRAEENKAFKSVILLQVDGKDRLGRPRCNLLSTSPGGAA